MSVTVGELMSALRSHGASESVDIDVTTKHSDGDTGIYVRVGVTVGGGEVLNMESDTRRGHEVLRDHNQATCPDCATPVRKADTAK